MIPVRVLATEIIVQVISQGRSLTDLIPKDHPDKAFLQELCFGTCRYFFLLNEIINTLLQTPLKQKDADIHALLLTALYQLRFMREPDYAVVNESVKVLIYLNKTWAKSLVNAVLRQSLRQSIDVKNKTSHPHWLIDAIYKAWPTQAATLLQNNNQAAPLFLRVNTQKCTQADYLELLQEQHIEATVHPHAGIQLTRACDITALPKFQEGYVSVQDAAAQLAAILLPIKPHDQVLDLCAAPGGKTAHCLELHKDITLTAVDSDLKRLEKITENLHRLNLHATLHGGDGLKFTSDFLFDAILLDAPCSATGVIRRHPDIKLLRRASDIKTLAALQLNLLKHAWTLLKPQGYLLYCTCSILPDENEGVIENFLKETHAEIHPISANWGEALKYGRQILPGSEDMDGFYYCLLQKN